MALGFNSCENPKAESSADGMRRETDEQQWASQTWPQMDPRRHARWMQAVETGGLGPRFGEDCCKSKISLSSLSYFSNSYQFYMLLYSMYIILNKNNISSKT